MWKILLCDQQNENISSDKLCAYFLYQGNHCGVGCFVPPNKVFCANKIQIYAPTTNTSEEDIAAFYRNINYSPQIVETSENTLVIEYSNTKIGEKEWYYRLLCFGKRNGLGDQLIQFYQQHD